MWGGVGVCGKRLCVYVCERGGRRGGLCGRLCARFWMSRSVTPGFSWISAGNSGCEQPVETWNRGKN